MSWRTLNRSSSVSSTRCLLNERKAKSCRWELGTVSLRVSSLPLRLLLSFFGAANPIDKRAQQWKPSATSLILRVLFLAVHGVGVPAPRRVPSSEGICFCHCGSFCLREAVQGTITSAHLANN